ncbi:hypothetical protein X798_06588 [Onchocerca flexuosa]|uniref:Uncharacterized protein n=1 Tax=Onchocerca flexuosa TaxID=387005 RepID=A0A238BP54_9BILA|nr:hypothetical protein X798_06588 [Onchocerca flexuosa]
MKTEYENSKISIVYQRYFNYNYIMNFLIWNFDIQRMLRCNDKDEHSTLIQSFNCSIPQLAKMLAVVFGDELDWRFSVLIKTMLIFNAIPVISLLLYIIISGVIIYSSAVLVHRNFVVNSSITGSDRSNVDENYIISFLFGLAIFAPIVLFSSLSALIVGFIIIISQRIFMKKSVQSLPSFNLMPVLQCTPLKSYPKYYNNHK